MQGDRAKKYQFASKNESTSLYRATTLLAIAIGLFAFYLIGRWLGLVQSYQYIFVGFLSFMIAFVVGYAFFAYMKYYYPFVLEKRLNKIRFKPMKSPDSGNEMRLLNELEEDQHLTQEMIDKEDAMISDFDVWLDEQTGHKIIQEYDTSEHALVCSNCNFRTLKESSEEVVREATENEEGLKKRDYKCTYCGHKETKDVRIPSWREKREMEGV
jgi:hypothetical protein